MASTSALMSFDEYLKYSSKPWGVPHCWVIDPVKQTGWEYDAQCDPVKVEIGGTLRAVNLAVGLADLFSPQPS
jgi:hypothetical protein